MRKAIWCVIFALLAGTAAGQTPSPSSPEQLPVPEESTEDSSPSSQDASDTEESSESEMDDLLSLDLEQLANVPVVDVVEVEYTPAALTETPRNVVPAAVTRITKEDIWHSGARNLNELLDIFVPNLQWVRHHWEQSHLGHRGIISDREDKYLLLVNGRIMNDKTHYGAASERELPHLNDIHHIDVIRGPGSAVLGPGAVSMVIAIYTDLPETFTGTDLKARGGVIDQFTSLEVKRGIQWENAEGGLLLYGGIGNRDGAHQRDAPLVLGTSDPGYPGFGDTEIVQYQDYQAGQDVMNPINRDGEAFQGELPLKFFADLTYNDFQIWTRYTRSGTQFPLAVAAGLHFPDGFGNFVPQGQSEAGNQQVTVQSVYATDVNEDLKLVAMAGWDHSEFARNLFFGAAESYAEEELNARLLLIQELGKHQVAVGGEFYQDWFGLPSHLLSVPATNGRLGGTGFQTWEAQTYSLLIEDQWKINDQWTTFIGGRWDKNTYTPWMYSPRAALVYLPDDSTAWKLLLNRSQRMNFAEELRAQWLSTATLSDPEIIRNYELRYERNPSETLFWALSSFYIDLDAISWDGSTSSSAITGRQTQWGMEGEMMYKHPSCTLRASHAFAKLIDFSLIDPSVTTFITAAPDGFGNDLSAWSNHISKIFVHRQLNQAWSINGTLRYYWGFPGSRDIVRRTDATPDAFGRTDPDIRPWKRPFRESVFLSLGLNYLYRENVRFRVDGYNLLGIFEPDLNKRIYYGDNSFRSEAPALAVTCEMLY